MNKEINIWFEINDKLTVCGYNKEISPSEHKSIYNVLFSAEDIISMVNFLIEKKVIKINTFLEKIELKSHNDSLREKYEKDNSCEKGDIILQKIRELVLEYGEL